VSSKVGTHGRPRAWETRMQRQPDRGEWLAAESGPDWGDWLVAVAGVLVVLALAAASLAGVYWFLLRH
jgi:hypothetical protein